MSKNYLSETECKKTLIRDSGFDIPGNLIVALLFCFFGSGAHQIYAQCADLVVAKDGTGDFMTIQEAITEAPGDGTQPFVIFIKNGIYDEKLFIEKDFITLIGEDRDSTIVTTAVLRRVWRETNPSDWGAATINIRNEVTDLTLANLTIRNNFADVFPDFPDNNDHTFAIRGGGHRVIILNCNVVTTGGDTLSLWNTSGGMFYHNGCFFEGYVDYVAPRGYCYITDSEFFGYNSNASIWHDGSGGKDHKLVIRRSVFDGVQNFALGRYHREAAFYLLDNHFSETMKNQEIRFVGPEPLMWGDRTYYDNNHRAFFDWPWFADNLETAEGSPASEEIDALWTFNGEWDPESLIDSLLPMAFLPDPAPAFACVGQAPVLVWVPGHCVEKHRVFFGTEPQPPLVAETTDAEYVPGNLDPGTTYYWRVDEIAGGDTVRGPQWTFRTRMVDDLPAIATGPNPPDGDTLVANLVALECANTARCSIDSFYFYIGTDPDHLERTDIEKYPRTYVPGLEGDTEYYWRVDTKNAFGTTPGEVWRFVLNPVTTGVGPDGAAIDGFRLYQNVPNPFKGQTLITYAIPESEHTALFLCDTQGQIVDTLFQGYQSAGEHQFRYMRKHGLPAGLYYCVLTSGTMQKSIKLFIQ